MDHDQYRPSHDDACLNMAGLIRSASVYMQLVKSGILLGNLLAMAGGFCLAARGHVDFIPFVIAVMATACLVAGAGALNNVFDRDIDAVMSRTKKRPLPCKKISVATAASIGVVLSLAGLSLLLVSGIVPFLLGCAGFIIYVGVYTLWLKRRSVHGTLIGSLSGAVPPAIGYAAAGGMDFGLVLLMLLFCLWQMPHSYAIALLREEDYRATAIPLPPLHHGEAWARRHIMYYLVAFLCTAAAMTASGYADYGFLVVAIVCGGYWLVLAVWERGETIVWARRQLICSLVTITVLSLTMGLSPWLMV